MIKTMAAVVTFNRLDKLKHCIDCLSQIKDIDIVVLDNASTDGTTTYLNGLDHVITIHQSTNTGGAGGFNTLMHYGKDHGYDRIWLMDDDTYVSGDAYQALLEADLKLNGQFGFLSSVVLYTDGKECIMNRFKIDKHFQPDIPYLKDGLIRLSQATFVSCYIHAQAISSLGYPIKEYFIWGDDMEYTLRLSKHYPCYGVGKSQVIHDMTKNVGSSLALDDSDRLDRYVLAFRNDFATAKYNGLYALIYYFGKCGINSYRILRYGQNHRIKRLSILLHGIIKGLWFKPRIERGEKHAG